MSQGRRTPLYDWHVAHGATLTDFAGWDMPVWYPTGAVAEHRTVITNAGLFDTSHMCAVAISGPDAFDLLQLCVTKDLNACVGTAKRPLQPGDGVFGAYLNDKGELIDDTILYMIAQERYLSVVNASHGTEIAQHLMAHVGGKDVQVEEVSSKVGKIDLQGPLSAKILEKVLQEPRTVLDDMQYFGFKGFFEDGPRPGDVRLTDGTPIMLSRTGFTGEFGFEILVSRDRLLSTWEMILPAGQGQGLIACGLAARDSLRAGGLLPLSHQDMGPWPFINNPWTFVLPFDEGGKSFTKKFIGDVVLTERDRAEHTYAFVGYDPRKVSGKGLSVVIDSGGNEIGVVMTCVSDMAIGLAGDRIYSMGSPDKPKDFKPGGLSCGFVRVKIPLVLGQEVELRDSRRTIKVRIVDDVRPDRTARRPMKDML
ncbi:MAG: aminomethyltransferase family protein [Thermodesulfobacteriota bacterium]